MDILSEIIEVSNQIIDTLEENDFFIENQFIDQISLKRALQIRMQQKWEQEEEMFLDDDEFLQVCQNVSNNEIANTIESLVEKGALNMSINKDGEILYSANKDYNWEEDDSEQTNW
jgi:gamma-glutamyltranspeptidase